MITSKSGELHWFVRYGISLVYLLLTLLYVLTLSPTSGGYLLVFAAVVGGYMAMNIGANDVANNVGPAVGSKALTLGGAILLAAIFEAAGALIAGGEVVGTIKSGIIDPQEISDTQTFVWLMTASLLAGAIWLNFATVIGAPVSTTHSIVGAVLGAGVAAGGMGIANWGNLGTIASSWVISPVMGGVIAASLLMLIKKTILYRDDVMQSARVYVPWLVAFMAWAFTTYLVLKGISNIWKTGPLTAALIGLGVAAAVYEITRRSVNRATQVMENTRERVNDLFTVPLVFAAALLSFAHGANDVANAIGPLAAIADALVTGSVSEKASIPVWVMAIGALGLSIGLAAFGPRLIRTVGSEITELDKSRAYCIAMSAAITVIIASQLGLPVSSTHIALGGIFGVGFLREYLKTRYASKLHRILERHEAEDQDQLRTYLRNFQTADVEEMRAMLKRAKKFPEEVPLTKKDRKRLKKIYKQELVKRKHLYRIAAAWVITVPASAVLGALMFFMLRGMLI